ncbi:DNA mismatch repair protein MutS [Psittacicella hinzii]|uniref:DNA mismatch repair protein MutS n=1 Tax=Psittacicella hinzii TaxID=2028575 RepID=A0A3A1YFG4_9GAMM|nr:DNA mismatch repair protein MutS [Psittacicella hinzii]RIY36029.1 DNA mismatch repair protein MutS [Psittacicella hinzii]
MKSKNNSPMTEKNDKTENKNSAATYSQAFSFAELWEDENPTTIESSTTATTSQAEAKANTNLTASETKKSFKPKKAINKSKPTAQVEAVDNTVLVETVQANSQQDEVVQVETIQVDSQQDKAVQDATMQAATAQVQSSNLSSKQDISISTANSTNDNTASNDISDDLDSYPENPDFTAIAELTSHIDQTTLAQLQAEFDKDVASNMEKLAGQTTNQDQLIKGLQNYSSPDFVYTDESIEQASPMMKQYLKIKRENRDKVLFFRMGDFYEFFFDDAVLTARELSLAVSSRQSHMGVTVPMSGIPYHAYEAYAAKLVAKGYSIAICEQTSDPKAKGLTERGVVRIFTPGTLSEESYLPARDSKPLVAVSSNYVQYVVALLDVSSGFVEVSCLDNYQDFLNRIQQYNPAEIIYTDQALVENPAFKKYHCTQVDSEYFTGRSPLDNIRAVWDKEQVARFQEHKHLIPATGALIKYVQQTQMVTPSHLQVARFAHEQDLVLLDSNTVHNLELFATTTGQKTSSFVEVLDNCSSTMGARLFRRWVRQPTRNLAQLEKRLDYVEIFLKHDRARAKLITLLKSLGDIERIVARISLGNASPKDLGELRNNLLIVPHLNRTFQEFSLPLDPLEELAPLRSLLLAALEDKQPMFLRDGGVIRSSFNEQLGDLRNVRDNVLEVLAAIEQREKERTGIETLSVKLNNQNEMYINIPTGNAGNLNKIPDNYIHKQTLKNARRFTTPELRDLEIKYGASELQIAELEKSIFNSILTALKAELKYIQHLANQLARLDVYVSFAQLAFAHNYVRPQFNAQQELTIKQGRHPVIEQILSKPFIANDTNANAQQSLAIITGPNMGGKSTYMRQNALIVLMALIGSFVPATYANIPLVDKILTRIGASDDISTGKSTFMVEMSEMAYILDNATDKSLLLIDEIGRGTSTFDGLSLAWGCAQYIAQNINALTFFSTHYFELTALSEQLPNVVNLSVSAVEHNEQISFLHEIKQGTANKSYGLAVAKLAGVPAQVLGIASLQLQHLTQQNQQQGAALSVVEAPLVQAASLSPEQQQALDLLQQANLNELTPINSLALLERLQQLLKGKKK